LHGVDQFGHSIEVDGLGRQELHERRLRVGHEVDGHHELDGLGRARMERMELGGLGHSIEVDGLGHLDGRHEVAADQCGDAGGGIHEHGGRLSALRTKRWCVAHEEPIHRRRVAHTAHSEVGHSSENHARGLELSHR
jgi:hypothetical protein